MHACKFSLKKALIIIINGMEFINLIKKALNQIIMELFYIEFFLFLIKLTETFYFTGFNLVWAFLLISQTRAVVVVVVVVHFVHICAILQPLCLNAQNSFETPLRNPIGSRTLISQMENSVIYF
jgi:hypothetical protein